ncbi:MAG: serine/threonine protein kinase [Labilithrix sp.]|nr:serine/threonine protein kinase [Labilithrix sp.]
MAEVFEGYSVGAGGFRRRVAIKRLTAADAGDPSMLRMFLDEAHICSALHHPGIVAVLDFGVVDGAPFQVMEYVDGVNAAEVLRRLAASGRASIPEVLGLHVCRAVAYALAHAHEAADADGPLGIVHRDVKPANILLSWNGDVKLADFGVALGRLRQERTEAGHVKGTLNYMAPEQLTGLAVDGRADVFALGCVLHTLITGVNPISAMSTSLALLGGVEPALEPSLPEDVRSIIETAIAGEVQKRFASAQRMAEALDVAVAARTGRDPRLDLEELLATLRATPSAPKRGALDQLLDIAFVQRPDTARDFETVDRTTKTHRDAPPTLALRPSDHVAPAPLVANAPIPGRTRRLLPTWFVLAPLLAVLGFGAWTLRRPPVPVAGSPPSPVSVTTSSPAPTFVSESPAPASAPPVASAISIASAIPIASATSVAPSRPPAAPPRATASHPATSTAQMTGSGFVAFRALEGATRTTIVVDGVARGFAPKVLELSAGTHPVSYVSGSGAVFGATQVMVRPEFSRASPAVIDVAAGPD